MRAHSLPLILCLLAVGAVGGCTYRKVVHYRPFLAGLPGAVAGEDVTPTPLASPDPMAMPSSVSVEPDGTVRVRAGSIRGLMSLVARAISDDPAVSLGEELARDERVVVRYARAVPAEERARVISRAVFTEEILSARIADEYRARGLDPAEAFDLLLSRRNDVMALFARMPMAEHTPDVTLREIDRNLFRLRARGMAGRDLVWASMDVAYERGGWRLVWFGR